MHGAVMLLARWTPYLESEMLGLADVVGPGGVCLDIGAAAGLYSLALSRIVGSTGEVHSIEPLQFAHPIWRRILGINACRNVRQYTIALGTEPGPGVMSVPFGRRVPVTGRSFLTGKSEGLGANAEFTRHEQVPVAVDTMDALTSRTGVTRVDFIKIDVEGAELHVLTGGERTVKEFRPAILVEIEARHTSRYHYATDDIVDWFGQRDYSMYTWQRGWQPASQVSLDRRNYLFRPNKPLH